MDFRPEDAARFRLAHGDVLVCEGGEVGRAAIWKDQLSECYYQKALHRIRTSEALSPTYLRYLLEHYARTRAFAQLTSGSTIAHLPQEDLRNLPVDLPPRGEQERIVAAIEEQFSRVDAGVAALDRVRQNLKRMRNAAFLELDLEAARSSLDKPLQEVAEFIIDGDHNPPKRTGSGIPYLTARHVKHGKVVVDRTTFVSAEDFELLRRRYDPRPGDVLVTCVGTLGEIAIVPEGLIFAADRNLAVIRPLEACLPRYVEAILRSPRHQKALTTGSGSTAQPHLYLKDLRATIIPIPTRSAQEELLARLDQHLSEIDRLKADLRPITTRLSVLRSSILSAAFSGKLTFQAPNDEPASVLLERIAAQRAQSNSPGKVQARRLRPTQLRTKPPGSDQVGGEDGQKRTGEYVPDQSA